MQISDRAYFEERAEAEIEAAHQAGHPAAARAHYVLAAYYLDLAHNPEAAFHGGPFLVARRPAPTPPPRSGSRARIAVEVEIGGIEVSDLHQAGPVVDPHRALGAADEAGLA